MQIKVKWNKEFLNISLKVVFEDMGTQEFMTESDYKWQAKNLNSFVNPQHLCKFNSF